MKTFLCINKPRSIETARFSRTHGTMRRFITRTGEATFINHTFMVILSDKPNVSSVDVNACAPQATGVHAPAPAMWIFAFPYTGRKNIILLYCIDKTEPGN